MIKNLETIHLRQWKMIGVFLVFQFVFFGCRTNPPEPLVHAPGQDLQPSSIKKSDLAGTWEFRDENGAYCLTLNREGHGMYEWQEGRLVTTRLNNGRWQGKWYQPKNDREGEFDLRLSPSGNQAEGRWWYTRIEDNHSPTQSGGRFALIQMPCSPQVEHSVPSTPPGEDQRHSQSSATFVAPE